MKPIVYVVQENKKRDQRDNVLRNKFDISPAAKFGELRILLGPDARPYEVDDVIDNLSEGLRDYKEEDYILLTGNPNFMLWIGMLLGRRFDTVKTLQWDLYTKGYIPIEAQI